MKTDLCPCGSINSYTDCCQRFHNKTERAQTPEQLMRSRYSAFALGEYQYLMDTHEESYRAERSVEELSRPPLPEWLALEVLDSDTSENSGTVTFKAWYKLDGSVDAIYEKSNFILKNNQWLYTDGEHLKVTFPKRNDLCICRSGKKFKKCCGS